MKYHYNQNIHETFYFKSSGKIKLERSVNLKIKTINIYLCVFQIKNVFQ